MKGIDLKIFLYNNELNLTTHFHYDNIFVA